MTKIGAAVMDIFGASLHPNMLNAVLDQTVRPAYPEIIVTVLVTICLGVFSAFAINSKWAFRLFFKMNLTNSFGEDDVWSYMMNSDEIDWVIVRDHEQDLAYLAKIEVFSDSEAPRELVLREVEVHKNSTWRLLYNTDGLYICRDAHKLSIEFLPLEGQDATSGKESPHGRQATERTETAPRR